MTNTYKEFGYIDFSAFQEIPEKQKITLNLLSTIQMWQARSKTRAALGQLDTHQLKDIGITAKQAVEESKKYFWMK